MQHGDPLTLLVNDDTVTVGIDLTTPTGIRFCEETDRNGKNETSVNGTSTLSGVTDAG